MSDSSDHEQAIRTNRLNRVLAEYLRRREAGEHVDMDALCAAHPDIADALRSYASGEGILEAMNQPLDPAEVESDASFGAETIRPGSGQRTDLLPNARFGRYRIIRLLGEGAMGAIYLAEDTTLDRQVALKIPKFNGREGNEFRQRFTREAKAAAKLDHPNICRVYDAGEITATPFITMEYIDGPTLSQLVGSVEFKDHRRVAEVVCGMAAGLALAHAQGILHRDLKPGNVLMKSGSIPCVTDFGLARSVNTTEESRITHEGTILGTPAYMSPEQIDGKPELLGPSTDIYALGAVLYELLTERLPFQGSVMAILAKAMHDPPTRLSKLCGQIDPTLEDLCLQMLEKSPDKRPQSMQEVVERLQQWLQKNSPEAQAASAIAQQTLNRLEGTKAKILDLIQRGQFAAAIAGLEKMLDLKSPDAADYVEWARGQLPKVRKLPKQLKQAIPALLNTARQCMQAYDYKQAAQLLQEIPADFRSDDVQAELDKAIALQDEADLLLADLRKCVRTKQYNGIEDNLQRFLELQPGNRFAKELHEALNTYSRIPLPQRRFRYDKQGKLQPLHKDNFLRSWLLWSCIVGLLAFGSVSWGILIYLKDGDQTLAVEVDDAWLKEQGGQLSLSVDGKVHTIIAGSTQVKVAFGEHGFSVKHGDIEVHSPQTFTLKKKETQVLHIDASGMRLESQRDPSMPETARSGSLAVVPQDPTTAATTEFELELLLSHDFTELAWEKMNTSGLATTGRGSGSFLAMGKYLYKFPEDSSSAPMQLSSKGGAYDIDITPDGRYIALARAFGRVEIWSTEPWEMKHRLTFSDTSGQPTTVEISPDGKWVGAAMMRGRAGLWELETGRLVTEIPIQADDAWTLRTAFSRDSQKLIVVGKNGNGRRIHEIETETGDFATKLCDDIPGYGAVAIGDRQRAVIAGTPEERLYLVNSETWQQEKIIGSCGGALAVAWSPDATFLAAAIPNNKGLALFDGATCQWSQNIELEGLKIEKVEFSRDSRILAVSGLVARPGFADGIPAIRVWRLSQHRL